MKKWLEFIASFCFPGSAEFRQLEFHESSTDRWLLLVNNGSSVVATLSGREGAFILAKARLLERLGVLFLDFEKNPDLHRVMIPSEELEIEDLDAALVWLSSGSSADYQFGPVYRRSVGKHHRIIGGLPGAAVVTVRSMAPTEPDRFPPEPRIVMNGHRIKEGTADFAEAIAMARLGILEAEKEAGWQGLPHVLERIVGLWGDGIDPGAARIAAGKATRSLIGNEQEGIG